MDNLIVVIIGFIQAILVVSIPIYLSWYIKMKDRVNEKNTSISPGDIEESVDKMRILKEMLGDLRIKLGATRAQVWLFHNGGNYFIGDSIKRITLIEEDNDIHKVSNIKDQFEGVPISRLEHTLYPFANKDILSYHEYNDLRHNDGLSEVNRVLKNISWSTHKILKDEKWVGLVFVSWDDHKELTIDQKILFKEKSKEIELHLLEFNALHVVN